MTERPEPPADVETDGWELVEETTETVFRLPTMRVEGHTLLYEDAALARAIAPVAPEFDGPWCFFFATRLTFVPPLAPGIGTASVYPTVASEAAETFERDLRERGFEDVERGRSERMRVDAGDRARLVKYAASYAGDAVDLDVEGWTAVWSHRGSFRVAGGAYPVRGLAALVAELPEGDRPAVDASSFRDELLDLIRAVE